MAISSNYAAFMFFIAVGKALKTLQGDGPAKSKDNAIDSMILSKELTHNSHRGGPASNSKTKETRAVLREIMKAANNSRAKTKAGKEGWSISEYLANKVPASLIRDLKKAAKTELNNLDLDDPQVAAEMKKMRGKPIVASTSNKAQDKQAILASIGEYAVKHGRSGLNQLLTSSLDSKSRKDVVFGKEPFSVALADPDKARLVKLLKSQSNLPITDGVTLVQYVKFLESLISSLPQAAKDSLKKKAAALLRASEPETL